MSDDSLPVPNAVERFDGAEIVAWDDVPEIYQKKILNGTMTEEDWVADWDISPKRDIEDVISVLLNSEPPVAKSKSIRVNHVHVFRKEYPKCMLKGCDATNPSFPQKMVGN